MSGRRGEAARAEHPTQANRVEDAERLLVGALALGEVGLDGLPRPDHFGSATLALLVATATDREGRGLPICATDLAAAMPEHERNGYALALAEAMDAAGEWGASLPFRVGEARREVLAAALARAKAQVAALAASDADLDEIDRALHLARALEAGDAPRALALDALALDLAAVRERPAALSPLPGLLPPEPSLVVVMARPKVGKSRLAFSIAQAAAAGVAPWPGAPALDLGPVALIEAEEPAADTVRTLDALAMLAEPQRDRSRWQERLRLFARDPALDPRAEALFRLDRDGLEALRWLARTCGLVVLDSLSRLKPPGVEEINNDSMTALLDELQRIAAEERCYLVVVHHQGHADRDDPVSVGRGASAIAAVARCLWHLNRVPGENRLRRLQVRGNCLADAEFEFEVASADAKPPGGLFYFRPHHRLDAYPIDDYLSVGESISTAELARRLDPEGEGKSGRVQNLAAVLRERWRRDGLVKVDEGGPGKATLTERVR